MSFDAVAPWYRTLETIVFGADLQRARIACLGEISSPRRALIVGEGNGRFLGEMLRRYPNVEVDCVDASDTMLQLARKRLERELPSQVDRVRFLHHDVISWSPPSDRFDLIVTHFFLDCFSEARVAEIVIKLADVAAEDAAWLLADFRIPAERFARFRANLWLGVMYRFFQFTAGIEAKELVDPSPFLQSNRFVLAGQHLLRHGMLKSQLWRRSL